MSGTQQLALASTTPGSARRRSRPFVTSCCTACGSWYRDPASDIRIVSTFVASKPGSTPPSAAADRISSAAPTSSTSASATSVTTRIERALFWRKPVPERPLLSFSVLVRSAWEPWSAGIRPNRRPVTSDTASVKARTRQSSPTSAPNSPTRGSPAVLTESRALMPR